MRGVDPAALLAEYLGLEQGLCHGQGGHMHLYSKEHWAASSGIVGASGPCGAGYALASQYLRPGAVAVSVFGEGALNQGMLMESVNLAVAWNLPQIFVCLDDGWAITTPSESQRGSPLCDRARGFGIPAFHVDGLDAESVWHAAGRAFERARSGSGPAFLHATCNHPEGHFLGDLLLDAGRNPLKQLPQYVLPLVKSLFSPGGAPIRERVQSLTAFIRRIKDNALDRSARNQDPVARLRAKLSTEEERLRSLEIQVRERMLGTLQTVLRMGNEEGYDAYADV
jgi:pyruvate dehydrogenase E1 component alpha subunit